MLKYFLLAVICCGGGVASLPASAGQAATDIAQSLRQNFPLGLSRAEVAERLDTYHLEHSNASRSGDIQVIWRNLDAGALMTRQEVQGVFTFTDGKLASIKVTDVYTGP